MKNKKLFAILTLVCFMFTLMPVAAFAADYNDHYVVAVEKNGVAISATDDSISVKAGDSVTVGVTTATSLSGVTTTAGLEAGFYFWVEDGEGYVEDLALTSGSYAEFDFDTVGTYYVYAVANSVVDVAAMDAAFYSDDKIVEYIKDKDNYVDDYMTVKVKKNSTVYTLTTGSGYDFDVTNGTHIDVTADNGWSSSELVVKLQKGAEGVKGEELTFSTNSSYVSVEVDDNYTDRRGEVEFTVSASKAGNYKLYVTADGAEKLTIPVVVAASNVASVETVAQPATNVALGTTFFYDKFAGTPQAGLYAVGFTNVAFEFTSADGSIMKNGLTKWTSTTPGDYKIIIVDQPADSTLDAEDLALKYDGNVNNAWVLFDENNVAAFDEEGKYVIKVALENGDSATATVNVVEFDEATRMILTMNSNTVTYGETVTVKGVSYMDAKGTMMVASHPEYSTYGDVEFAANGKAVASVVTTTGAITAKGEVADGDELIGTTITAFAINEELELTATATITVVDKAAELKYQSTTADIAVNNKLIVNPVDENGNVIANLNKITSTPSVYVLSAPANAAYSVEAEVTDTDELTVTLTASAAGEYKLQTVVRTAAGAYLSSVDTIVVGGTTSEFKDVIVMSIGANQLVKNSEVVAMPAAPEIVDSRTMVPARAGLEAFGATVVWDEATQTVTAELNGVKVVMEIGEKAYTVNGKAMVGDAAPYITSASTMVPVSFFTNAFGITATPIYDDHGVCDVLFAK